MTPNPKGFTASETGFVAHCNGRWYDVDSGAGSRCPNCGGWTVLHRCLKREDYDRLAAAAPTAPKEAE